MGATRLCVHVRRTDGSILVSETHQVVDLLLTFDVNLTHILQVDTFPSLLVDSQVVLTWVDQVLDALVVNFDHTDVYREHDVLRSILNFREDSAHHPWDDSLQLDVFNVGTLHRMSLARGCLSVRENRTIETIQDGLNDRLGSCIIHLFLSRLHVEHMIKVKVRVLLRHLFLLKASNTS